MCVFVCLQDCLWFWWCPVCLSESADCRVHEETEDDKQVLAEEVSV